MKKIEAFIRHEALESVQAGLSEAGIRGMTVTGVRGAGGGACGGGSFGSLSYPQAYLPKLKLEILVADGDLGRAVDVIVRGARTGLPGDGSPMAVTRWEVARGVPATVGSHVPGVYSGCGMNCSG